MKARKKARKLGKLVTIYKNKDCKSVVFLFRIEYTAKTTKALHTSTRKKTQQFPKTLRAREKRRRAEAAAAEEEGKETARKNPTVVPTSIECRPVPAAYCRRKKTASTYCTVLDAPSSCMHAGLACCQEALLRSTQI
jgi:hypothetical protein